MKKNVNRILYGGDYNPNQWPREVWEEDMRYFREAHINSATVNVFSWAKLQPSEETYDFSELDEVIDLLSSQDYDIVLATGTGALPAWMFKRYPEVARTDYEGRRHKFGGRHNACPNSPVYQNFSVSLAGKLAERYGGNPHIVCWHISNEYGGECYCENCEKAFRVWLRKKYGTLDALNRAWNMEFWGHTVYDWDEIVLPNALGDGIGREKTAFPGLSLDYCRFNSGSILNAFILERDAIRQYDPDTPITTNLMGTYKGLDYFKWAKEMDVVSWDNYPSYNTPWSYTAMRNDLMRGLKDQPFMLMEQTPSQQNWQPYNSLKRPGQMRAQSYQTLAHGGDTIQFFQLRRSVGGCEKFHGAVISHAGRDDTRVFREVQALGEELEKLGSQTLGSLNEAEVGIVFDWDNYWALEYSSGPTVELAYVKQIHEYYRYFYDRNVPVSLVPADGDFSRYKLLVAPVLYMVKEGMQEALEAFVRKGGTLVTTFMSGIVNESDNVYLGGYPGPLKELAGLWVEELDALAPEASNEVRFTDGSSCRCRMLCDLIHLTGAESLGDYGEDFYAGTPAVARNRYGAGTTYYVGTSLEEEGLSRILGMACETAGVAPLVEGGTGLEITCRKGGGCRFWYVINFQEESLPLPPALAGLKDLLTGETIEAGHELKKYDVLLLREED